MESSQSKVKSANKEDTNMIIEEVDQGSRYRPKSDEPNFEIKPLTEFDAKESFFMAKKISDFSKIIKGANIKIKSISMNSGQIEEKLKSEELSLKNCTNLALDKILKADKKEDIEIILTYDNTNEKVLYYCLIKLKQLGVNINVSEYKYCFTNYLELDDKNKIDLHTVFNYKFIFNDIEEAKDKFSYILSSLLEYADLYEALESQDDKNNVDISYNINEKDEIIMQKNYTDNKKVNEINTKGYDFIEFYPKIKDFKKFKNYYPYDYNNNKILYLFFLINTIYSFFIDHNENKIKIRKTFIKLIFYFRKTITSIVNDLKHELNVGFFIKIKFLALLFCLNVDSIFYYELAEEFESHLFESAFTEKEANNIINTLKKKENKRKIKDHIVTKESLKIKIEKFEIPFYFNDYPNNLYSLLSFNNKFIISWKFNSLESFQYHNFYNKEDIDYLKNLVKIILKSDFWKDIENTYIENDIYEGYLFDDDEKINQFINNIIFVPFFARNLKISGYTFDDDLKILITGYPMIGHNTSLVYHKINRILNLSLLTIVILHECIHYTKRLLYFITNGIIARKSDEGVESGFIFEKLVFGWGDTKEENKNYYGNNEILKSKKFDIKIALKLLNPNTYNNNINNVRNILYNYKKEEDINIIFKNYLIKLGLNNNDELQNFINVNNNITINAQRCFAKEFYIEYSDNNHNIIRNNN